jgi:hypothetical protein
VQIGEQHPNSFLCWLLPKVAGFSTIADRPGKLVQLCMWSDVSMPVLVRQDKTRQGKGEDKAQWQR